jgi:hypothetical protein
MLSSGANRLRQYPVPACVSGLTKIEAEDLIDWLEATGRRQWKLTFVEGEGFAVSFR